MCLTYLKISVLPVGTTVLVPTKALTLTPDGGDTSNMEPNIPANWPVDPAFGLQQPKHVQPIMDT